MKRSIAVVAGAVLLAGLAGCSTDGQGDDLGLQRAAVAAATAQDSITIAEVVGEDVEAAYVFCPYTVKEDAEKLGFDPKDFPDINNNVRAWETASGIGVTYTGGKKAEVEWFDPLKLDACAPEVHFPEVHFGEALDPRAPIAVRQEDREFAREGNVTIAVLQY